MKRMKKTSTVDMSNNLIIYGGSFDPPHMGHRRCLIAVREKYPIALIRILPALVSPGKDRVVPTAFNHRAQMCRLSLQIDEGMVVDELEATLPSPSYTLQTLMELTKDQMNHGEKARLVIGQDQLASFSQWMNPSSILQRADLLVLPREGFGEPIEDSIQVLACKLGYEIEVADLGAGHFVLKNDTEPIHIDLLRMELCPISSTSIRAQICSGLMPQDDCLYPEVLHYIKKEQLYAK